MVIKENMSTDPFGKDMYDELDSRVTRTDAKFRHVFKEAGMEFIWSETQSGFPKQFQLLPVRSYAFTSEQMKYSSNLHLFSKKSHPVILPMEGLR